MTDKSECWNWDLPDICLNCDLNDCLTQYDFIAVFLLIW